MNSVSDKVINNKKKPYHAAQRHEIIFIKLKWGGGKIDAADLGIIFILCDISCNFL